MKCVVTGHTSGIGKALYEHFQSKGWEVIGMSRSNGYNIVTNQQQIISEATGCDLFINCAYENTAQEELLIALHNKVGRMIVVGSVAADWAEQWVTYGQNKLQLERKCKELANNILYLKLAFCENACWPITLNEQYVATFQDITNAVEFWLHNPKVFSIEFVLEQTQELKDHVAQYSSK